ncbi:hypothetical protein [Cryobacterium zongtaii]|uniref:hypothetical protein n=1 Tax=Cryobacterium zongtaii TaxID=1259217 RepID=UPI00105724A1|nr:hypothetical protein [Cryobacterium zongtaii]
MIDLASVPVNYHRARERNVALTTNVVDCVQLASSLAPDGIVAIKKNVFELLQEPLLSAGLPLLHDEYIPFPGSGQQKRFQERFATAYAQLPAPA